MHENARQILDIVRGTFPGLPSDGVASTDCTLSQSDGETLSCLWSTADSSVKGLSQGDSVTALQALTEVSGNSLPIRSNAKPRLVRQTCTRHHEQHCQQLRYWETQYRYSSCCAGNCGKSRNSFHSLAECALDRTLDFLGNHPVRCDDVRKQLRRGGTSLLVLGIFGLAWMALLQTVRRTPTLDAIETDGT